MAKRFISTSIAYINAEPHIGFLFELVAADVLARYYRSQGDEVFFLTGTDEHGTKVEQAAAAANLAPQEFADQLSTKFKALGKEFNLSFDKFVRTTDPQHIEFVKKAWQKLDEKKVLEKRAYDGWYCTGCEAFKTEREIVDGKCGIHEIALEKISEENYFLLIGDDVKEKIRRWIGAVKPVGRQAEVLNMLEEIDAVSVSRPKDKLQWGIQVPGDDNQVMYVWVDALLNYLSGIEAAGQETKDWWPGTQLIGKDILKFHAVIWPAILDALGYEFPKELLVHGFINVDGKKMSKSLGNVIAPSELKARYGVDGTRYLLLRQLNFYDDSNFVWSEFDALYNGELANGIGNLINRTVSILKSFEQKGFKVRGTIETAMGDDDIKLKSSLGQSDYRNDLETVISEVAQANDWFSKKKPWEWKSPTDLQLAALIDQRKLIQISYLLEPFMPETATEIRRQLKELDPKPLFPRL